MKPTKFAKYLSEYLTVYLPNERGYSYNTIMSYRDNMVLFLTFMRQTYHIGADRIDYANATNLFTISDYYDGYDPETAYQSGSQGAVTGSIGNNYPLCSTYTFGAEIKF